MRDILIALCGLTPQVVTETLWALRHRPAPIIPKEIWIITTRSGQQACRRDLFGPSGHLAAYLQDYPASRPIRCGPNTMIGLKGADGRTLDDLRTQQDNQAVADQLAAFLKKRTAAQGTRLHCSIAGGRKTMGVLLAAALQLYARPDDRLYHVLVSPEFESLPEFFYPPKTPRTIIAGNRRLNTKDAKIELAEIPFVRLRSLLPPGFDQTAKPFVSLVEQTEQRLRALADPDPMRLEGKGSKKSSTLWIGDRRVRLPPAQGILYRALVTTKLNHCKQRDLVQCGDCMDCFLPFTKESWETTKAVLEERGGGLLLPKVKKGTLDDDRDALTQFRSLVSKLNHTLGRATGLTSSENPYRVRSSGPKGETVYGLALDKTKMTIEEGTLPDGA